MVPDSAQGVVRGPLLHCHTVNAITYKTVPAEAFSSLYKVTKCHPEGQTLLNVLGANYLPVTLSVNIINTGIGGP